MASQSVRLSLQISQTDRQTQTMPMCRWQQAVPKLSLLTQPVNDTKQHELLHSQK